MKKILILFLLLTFFGYVFHSIPNSFATKDATEIIKQLEADAKAKADADAAAKKAIKDATRNFYSSELGNKIDKSLFTKDGVSGKLLPKLATWITGFLAAIAVLFLMYAGYEYMTAGGEEEKLTHARNTALYTILGVVLMMFAYALVYLFLTLFTP